MIGLSVSNELLDEFPLHESKQRRLLDRSRRDIFDREVDLKNAEYLDWYERENMRLASVYPWLFKRRVGDSRLSGAGRSELLREMVEGANLRKQGLELTLAAVNSAGDLLACFIEDSRRGL